MNGTIAIKIDETLRARLKGAAAQEGLPLGGLCRHGWNLSERQGSSLLVRMTMRPGALRGFGLKMTIS